MKINTIDNLGYVISVEKAGPKKSVEPEKRPDQDKLVLSDEAKRLNGMKSNLTPERLELIRQRIAENFYDQDEIISEVADRMLKSDAFRQFRNGTGTDQKS
ncbi:MAG: hypothetical protein H6629_04160 [Calditrichae bacterium]|nr:hypothetical protein [Calditrichia bacterium]